MLLHHAGLKLSQPIQEIIPIQPGPFFDNNSACQIFYSLYTVPGIEQACIILSSTIPSTVPLANHTVSHDFKAHNKAQSVTLFHHVARIHM